ncbi:unnamed protein product [Effrenium voratum]|nr:unnamed protein product [Effrenium voratum]
MGQAVCECEPDEFARLSAGSAASCEIDEKLGPLRCVGDQLDFPHLGEYGVGCKASFGLTSEALAEWLPSRAWWGQRLLSLRGAGVGLRDRFFTRLPFRPMMKLCLLLIALAADAAKARIRVRTARGENPCPNGLTNRLGEIVMAAWRQLPGCAQSSSALDFRVDDQNGGPALSEDSEWKIGMPWLLKATFSSDSKVDRTFGFASGGSEGFLTVTVPAGVQEQDITVTGPVGISGADAEFQYKRPAGWTSGKIVMSNICLAPRSCDNFECPQPGMKKKGDGLFGFSTARCCEMRMCTEAEGVCLPETMYTKAANFSEKKGYDNSTCCSPKYCPTDLCTNDTKWVSKGDVVLGSTKAECCERLECATYTCSNQVLMTKSSNYLEDGTPRFGSTDEECCETKFCSAWQCSDDTKWVHLSNQHGATNLDRRGYSDEECCDQRFCLSETCDPSTQWKAKEDFQKIQGSTKEQCCDKIYCNDFVCDTDVNNTGVGTQWYKRVDTNIYKWQGSTNEECCMPIFCSQYTTSHPTRWSRKKDPSVKGSTDVECYDPLLCSDYCCDKQAGLEHRPNPESHQGSTDEECCVKAQ